MPIPYEVTLYGCRFKCGSRRTQKKKLIEKHEETCFANPERRACKTCKHDRKSPDPEDCYCALDVDQNEADCLRAFGDGKTITCRSNCPGWELKDQ